MYFKIRRTDVNISFTFLALLLLCVISPVWEIYLYTFLSSLIHEFIHIICILLFKSEITYFSLSVFGANIKRSDSVQLSLIKEAIISLSAPFFNLILGIFTCYYNEEYKAFGFTNIFIGIFNLLPFFTFDGGRGVYYLLKYFFSEKTSDSVITVTSVLTAILTAFISVYIFMNYKGNYTLIIFSCYMIFALILKKGKIF